MSETGSGSTFGPSALLTPANAITVARLLATPVVIGMVAVTGAGWLQFGIALAIGATDVVDGWLARRMGATRSGAFLDPLADKVGVVGVLCAAAARGEVQWLPVALVAARELSMQVYRSVMGRRGVSIPARRSAKVKTLFQGIASLLCMTPGVATHHGVLAGALWAAVVLTIVSGAQYVRDGRRAARAVQAGPAADSAATGAAAAPGSGAAIDPGATTGVGSDTGNPGPVGPVGPVGRVAG